MDSMRLRRAIPTFSRATARSSSGHLAWLGLPKWGYLAATLRAAIIAVSFLLPAVPVGAQTPQEATYIKIGAPHEALLGDPLTVQAVLVDSHGKPIANASVYFTAPAQILNSSADVNLAQAVTNKDGQGVAQIGVDTSGILALSAVFRGDDRYAPSKALTQIQVTGDSQVYAEHIGVDIPGFNVPPVFTATAYAQSPMPSIPRIFYGLWPAMTAWPIGAALIIVWSLYLVAVTFLFRIAAPTGEIDPASSLSRRRRSS